MNDRLTGAEIARHSGGFPPTRCARAATPSTPPLRYPQLRRRGGLVGHKSGQDRLLSVSSLDEIEHQVAMHKVLA
jgi:hypothetical protein